MFKLIVALNEGREAAGWVCHPHHNDDNDDNDDGDDGDDNDGDDIVAVDGGVPQRHHRGLAHPPGDGWRWIALAGVCDTPLRPTGIIVGGDDDRWMAMARATSVELPSGATSLIFTAKKAISALLCLSQARLAEPDGDWGEAQDLATLWFLNNHGVVPESVLTEHTNALIAVCERFYAQWDWEAVSMLCGAVEEMITARWDKAPTTGGRLLDMAEAILWVEEDKEQREHYLGDVHKLRQQLSQM